MKPPKILNAVTIWLIMVACTAASSNAQTVYITNTGSKYHRASCQYLRKSQYAIAMKEAVDRGYEPCSVCEPGSPPKEQKTAPVNDRTDQKTNHPDTTRIPSTQTPSNENPVTPKPSEVRSRQCTGTTKAGTRCKRMTTSANGKCYQHE